MVDKRNLGNYNDNKGNRKRGERKWNYLALESMQEKSKMSEK